MTIVLNNKQQALAFRDEIADKLDLEMETAGDALYSALADVRAALVLDVNSRVAQLPSVLNYQPPATMSALVAAHNIYYDAEREQEISNRNGLKHPGFAPGGEQLEYLN